MDFSYWNEVDPTTFLIDDLCNPSRVWAGEKVTEAVLRNAKTMIEVGPGAGADYERLFRPLVTTGLLSYTGFEGSSGLYNHLKSLYPESTWQNKPLKELQTQAADIVYVRHVLEHQETLEPNLTLLLQASKSTVIIVWYRPPAEAEIHQINNEIHYWTFKESDVFTVIAQAGWLITDTAAFPTAGPCGNLGWVLTKR